MITGVNSSKVGVYMSTKRRTIVRSVRLSEDNDKKFLKVHDAFKAEYQEKISSMGMDSTSKEWSYADTVTRMVRETFDKMYS